MIKNQEDDGSPNSVGFLPKYTAEKMLMAYFIKKSNSIEDVKSFYQNVIPFIKTTNDFLENYNQEVRELRTRIFNINDFLIKFSNSNRKVFNPYHGNKLVDHGGETLILDVDLSDNTSDNKCKFLINKFPNCAETAMKHILNLLLFSRNGNWDFIENFNEKELSVINNMLKSQQEGTEFEYLPFKERLTIFLKYQKKHGVNDNSDNARNIFNYVISNMTNSVEKGRYYPLLYCKIDKNCNEAKTGLLNNLKFIYNAALALQKELNIGQDKLDIAKDKLDDLIKEIGMNSLNNDNIKNCAISVYGLINDNLKIEVNDEIFKKDDDVISAGNKPIVKGLLNENLSFSLFSYGSHAYTECEEKTIKKQQEFVELADKDTTGINRIFYEMYFPKEERENFKEDMRFARLCRQ